MGGQSGVQGILSHAFRPFVMETQSHLLLRWNQDCLGPNPALHPISCKTLG